MTQIHIGKFITTNRRFKNHFLVVHPPNQKSLGGFYLLLTFPILETKQKSNKR